MAFYAVKTTASQESRVVDGLTSTDGVKSAFSAPSLTAYIIAEATDESVLERAVRENHHAKVLLGSTSPTEVKSLLKPRSAVEGLEAGAMVEITNGPYEGDKAQVTSVTQNSEKVTVELADSTVPIPIELPGDQVRKLN